MMKSILIFFASITLIAASLLVAFVLYQLAYRFIHCSWMLRRSSGPYHCYYACEKDIMADARARHMASICHYGYTDSYLNSYCTNLTTDSLPMEKLLSWTRTVHIHQFAVICT